MGGNAAKERRKLKRLAEQQKQKGESSGGEKKAKTDINDATVNKTNNTSPKNKTVQGTKYVDRKRNAPHDKSKFSKNNHHSEKKFKDKKGYRNDKSFQKSSKKIPVKAKKIKKPKHLARKLRNESDPEIIRELKQKQMKMDEKKRKSREKFKLKIIELVGGKKYFNSIIFDELMEKGGDSVESIVTAVKTDGSEVISSENVKVEETNEGKVNKLDVSSNIKNNETKRKGTQGKQEPEEELTDSEEVPEAGSDKSSEGENERKERKTEKKSEDVDYAKNDKNEKKVEVTVPEGEDKESDSDGDDQNDDKSSESSSSDSEDDEDLTLPTGRTRGRRRKGRQDADAEREKQNETHKKMVKDEENKSHSNSDIPKVPKDKRRCIGRKALTDFEIGKKYTGTVVYVKPKLGIFIDINCHSDAFCHISRCADGYVEEITNDIYKVGDVLEDKVRLVNIDHKKKKITASLQTDDRIKDEEKSNETWKQRQIDIAAKKEKKYGWKKSSNDFGEAKNHIKFEEKEITSNSNDVSKEHIEEAPIVIDPDNMSPAELKRARKLQRRAERRKQKELTGISA